jgi:O-antigen/teichoic acid export membrane protein
MAACVIRFELLRGVIGLGSIRLAGLLSGLILNVVLARSMEPAAFGSLALYLALIAILSAVSSGGATPFLTRGVATAVAGNPGRQTAPVPLRGLLLLLALGSLLLAAMVYGLLQAGFLPPLAKADGEARPLSTSLLIAVGLCAFGVLAMVCGILRGAGKPVAGDLPSNVALPVLLVVGIVVFQPLITADPFVTFAAYVGVAVVVSLIAAACAVGWSGGSVVSPAARARPDAPVALLRTLLPFLALATVGAASMHAGTVMVGIFAGEEATATYRVADRVAALVSVPLVVVNAIIGAEIARGYQAGDAQSVRRLVSRARRISIGIAVPLCVGFFLLGSDLVATLFGEAYSRDIHPTLAILATGHLINVACGSVGLALMMGGHERLVLREQSLAIFVALFALPPAIILWGEAGAAAVVAGTMALWNIRLLRRLDSTLATAAGEARGPGHVG